MAYFVIEINIPNSAQEHADNMLEAIASIIESAGGKLVDYGIKMQVLILIVDAKSELIMVDLLEANAINIGQIRHIFLMAILPKEINQEPIEIPSFAGFFGGMDLRNTVAIEVYPH